MHKRVLVVGNFNWYFYEEALIEGFKSINVETFKFEIRTFDFKSKIFNFRELKGYNNELINVARSIEPDAVFFYRTNEVLPNTLKKLKVFLPSVKLLFYNNDNPFIGFKNKVKYSLYLKCLKYSDITYVYRPSNIADAKKWKAKNIKLLYPHYCTSIHLGNRTDYKEKLHDIVFIGHFEKNRGDYIDALVKANIKVKVFGDGWNFISEKLKWPNEIVNKPVYRDKYRKTISDSKMALCFLSKLNNDVYTRRNFEIPAAGTIVVSEYTKELSQLFKADKEIIMFNDKNEMVDKVKYLLCNDDLLSQLTEFAYNKIISANHSEIDRAQQILNDILINE